MKLSRLVILIGGLVVAPCMHADIWISSLFTDGAVLQRGKPIPVWGSGTPGTRVQVRFGDASASTVADQNWRWMALLPALPASSEPRELVVSGEGANILTVRNVVVGDVWLCAGQSNIEWPLSLAEGGREAMAGADLPRIRQLRVPRGSARSPRDDIDTAWKVATPGTAGEFTAVGFFFARSLQPRIGVPIGLINCTYGGTPVESWLAPETLAADPDGLAYVRDWESKFSSWPKILATFLDQYRTGVKNPSGASIARPLAVSEYNTPSGAYFGMVCPLVPYPVRGVLWYQGESNAGRPEAYRRLFRTLIASFRELWSDPEMPFLFVQLPNWEDPNDRSQRNWAEIRDAQESALDLPNTEMAVTLDVGDPAQLHPARKAPIGERLALLAAHAVYGLSGEYSGPVVNSVTREDSRVRIRFRHAEGGVQLRDSSEPQFELAGSDSVFHPASATVRDGDLLVHSPEVDQPALVRYAWRNAPQAVLFNREGLPARPFRRSVE